jgi:hypothetical protein
MYFLKIFTRFLFLYRMQKAVVPVLVMMNHQPVKRNSKDDVFTFILI